MSRRYQLTGDGATYTYNARGQQATYSKSGVTASYTYLPTGLRKSKTVGVITTNYVWDGQNMVYEYNGTNTIGGTAYYYGLTLISQDNNAYYLYNGHGDVVQLVTASGTLGRSYEYDAFGNEVNPSATDTNPFRYAGQYFDTETGTYYLRARYYNPSLGRFTQQDSWEFADINDPLSLNLYTYCWNDPIMYVDPSGQDAIWLQYKDEAKEFGHTGLLLQDNKKQWHLFYWGTRNPREAIIGLNKLVIDKDDIFEELGSYKFNRNNLLNDVLSYISKTSANKNMHRGISGALYFEGDFTKSVQYINEVMDTLSEEWNETTNKQYNLYFNNCLHMSVKALLEGTFKEHDARYKVALEYAYTSLIPNDAYQGMWYFTSNIDKYMKTNWFLRLFSSPYIGFSNYRNSFY